MDFYSKTFWNLYQAFKIKNAFFLYTKFDFSSTYVEYILLHFSRM